MLENILTNEEILDEIVTDIMTTKGTINAQNAAEEKKHLIGELSDRIEKTILSALPLDKLEELDALLDNENASAKDLQNLVQSANLDIPKITKEVIETFREKYLNEGAK